jgi:hypothetical protein
MILKSRILENVMEIDHDEVEIDEILERMIILNKISEADKQIEIGQVIEEETANKIMDGWFA